MGEGSYLRGQGGKGGRLGGTGRWKSLGCNRKDGGLGRGERSSLKSSIWRVYGVGLWGPEERSESRGQARAKPGAVVA